MSFAWLSQSESEAYRGREFRSAQGARVCWQGRELVNFASDDYLNLAADRRPARAAARALRRYGCGAGSAPFVAGYLPPQQRLEAALAEFVNTEAALVFPGGYDACLGAIAGLLQPEDAIFADCLNQAGLRDGAVLAGAAIYLYDHAQPQHLDELLRQYGRLARRRLIVTDSVFGLDGDLAPLQELAILAVRHGATLLVHEAHALGVFGPRGRGLSEWLDHWHLSAALELIKVGSLGKALGAQGGFVAGPRPLIDGLRQRARPYAVATALAPPLCAAARRALQLVDREPWRRIQLLRLAAELRSKLRGNEIAIGASESQIVSVLTGETAKTLAAAERLRDRGFLVGAIVPPHVPSGAARLRLTITAGHYPDEVQRLAETLRACRPSSALLAA